jgi:hypothetical protein
MLSLPNYVNLLNRAVIIGHGCQLLFLLTPCVIERIAWEGDGYLGSQ